MAHSLWGQQGAPLLSGFLDLVTRNYGSEMRVVNFSCDPEGACRAINSWVETKTHERIRDLIGRLDRDTRLVVVNTVYFKGKWALEFTELATRDEPFYLEGGGTVQARLMHQQEEVRYLQADGFQVVDLDYRGGDLSLLVLLPDTRDGLGDLEARLSAHLFRDCVAKMAVREVEVLLPRFKMTCRLDVRDDLCALGMPRAFQRLQADFSGINGHTPPHQDALFISAVCHQAFIEVNEQGTEAAAATGISMMRVGMAHYEPAPVPIFRANHPFLFAIRDRKSTAILFLGRMADPTRES
jgi:serpin B